MNQPRRTAALGRYGEELAARHLQSKGWALLDRNWRCEHGELDIVAQDARTLVAVEVKTRSGTGFGQPVEAITPAKADRLRRLLLAYSQANRTGAAGLRIDVVGVLVPRSGRPRVVHVRGVAQ